MGDYDYFGPSSKWESIGSLIGGGLMLLTWTAGLGYLIWWIWIR